MPVLSPMDPRGRMRGRWLGRRTGRQSTGARALAAWTQPVGSIGFEVFGHLNNVIHDYERYFNYHMSGIAQNLALKESPTTSFPEVV
jgi:hypothetical protein